MAYLLVAWSLSVGFFLLPLAGLLLLTRPVTFREWAWVFVAFLWVGLWFSRPAPAHLQVAKAASVMATGTLVALRLARPSLRPGSVILAAVGLGVAGTVFWCASLGISWESIHAAALQEGYQGYRRVLGRIGAGGPSRQLAVESFRAAVTAIAVLFPGLAALIGLAGLRLAWGWHRRIARRPLEPEPRPFAAFRFNDHLVWGLVAALALVLLAPIGPGSLVGQNLLLVFGALYAVRGTAVVTAMSAGLPRFVAMVFAVSAVLLFPFAATALMLLGLADTWIDVRRRLPPLPGGETR